MTATVAENSELPSSLFPYRFYAHTQRGFLLKNRAVLVIALLHRLMLMSDRLRLVRERTEYETAIRA